MCEDWKNDFTHFYSWAIKNKYNDNLSIDRIDVNGNYEPTNCRWVTLKEQARNTQKHQIITRHSAVGSLLRYYFRQKP